MTEKKNKENKNLAHRSGLAMMKVMKESLEEFKRDFLAILNSSLTKALSDFEPKLSENLSTEIDLESTDNNLDSTDNDSATSESDSAASIELPGMPHLDGT